MNEKAKNVAMNAAFIMQATTKRCAIHMIYMYVCHCLPLLLSIINTHIVNWLQNALTSELNVVHFLTLLQNRLQ